MDFRITDLDKCFQIAAALPAAPIYSFRWPNSTICGHGLSQNYLAYSVWNYIILTEKPDIVIEIGTSVGGFSCLLGKTCQALKTYFVTYDIRQVNNPDFESHGVIARNIDVFSDDGMKEIEQSLGAKRDRKAILLCDGGNKIKEFNTFAGMIGSGSIIAGHDFIDGNNSILHWAWSEINIPAISESVDRNHLVRYKPEWLTNAAWIAYKKS